MSSHWGTPTPLGIHHFQETITIINIINIILNINMIHSHTVFQNKPSAVGCKQFFFVSASTWKSVSTCSLLESEEPDEWKDFLFLHGLHWSGREADDTWNNEISLFLFLYLMICLGIDERRRVTILGMHDCLRMDEAVLRTLWPFGGTVLTRSKCTLFSLRSPEERCAACMEKKKAEEKRTRLTRVRAGIARFPWKLNRRNRVRHSSLEINNSWRTSAETEIKRNQNLRGRERQRY